MDSKYTHELEANAAKAIEFFESELGNIHTGRATTSLVSEVLVDAYGTKSPLKQVANITVTDSRSLAIQPWDKGNMVQIESALREANLGFGIVNSGDAIRVSIPELTEERRNEYVKMVKSKAEEAKISIRNVRRDVWEHVKKDKANGDISEDELYRSEDEINKFVEVQNKRIDDYISAKEKELREV
jgi:ribosome recycling factor